MYTSLRAGQCCHVVGVRESPLGHWLMHMLRVSIVHYKLSCSLALSFSLSRGIRDTFERHVYILLLQRKPPTY
jgi:hypothetical protein